MENPEFNTFVTGEEKSQLTSLAIQRQRELDAQERSKQDWIEKQQKHQYDAAIAKVTNSLIKPDGSIEIGPGYFQAAGEAGKLPGALLDPAGQRAVVDFGNSILKEQLDGSLVPSDPHTYDDFRQRLFYGQNDLHRLTPAQVMQARLEKRLSTKDASFFLESLDKLDQDPAKREAEKRFNEFLNGMKPTIGRSDMFGNFLKAEDAQNFYYFQHDAREVFENAYAKGTWQQLLDERNPAYLGNALRSYTQPDLKSVIKRIPDILQKGTGTATPPPNPFQPKPGVLPRNPGESAADYLKRKAQSK